MTLAPGTLAHPEPVLSSGDASGADVVSVRRSDPGHVVFSYQQSPAGAAIDGPALPLPPGPIRATVVLDRPAGRVRVTLADQTVLDVPADLRPLERGGLHLGPPARVR